MKSLFRGFAALVLMVIAFAASAKTVDLSKYASGEGWQQFSSALVADKMMAPGSDRFDTVGLSNVMYNALGEAEQATVSRVGFHSLNQVVNNLPSEMTVGEFKKRAGNLKLPPVQVVADAKASAQTPTTMVPVSAPQVQAPAAPVVTAENVRKQLEELSKTVDGKYSGINRRVAELQAGLKKAALKDDIAKIVKETQTIIDLTNRVKVVEDRINHPETGLNAINGKAQTAFNMAQSASEGVDGLAKQFDVVWVGMVAVGLIALLAIGFGFVAMRRAATAVETATRANRVTPTL